MNSNYLDSVLKKLLTFCKDERKYCATYRELYEFRDEWKKLHPVKDDFLSKYDEMYLTSPEEVMRCLDLPNTLKGSLISRVTGNTKGSGWRKYYGYRDKMWEAIDKLEPITIEDLERLDSEYEIPEWNIAGLPIQNEKDHLNLNKEQ